MDLEHYVVGINFELADPVLRKQWELWRNAFDRFMFAHQHYVRDTEQQMEDMQNGKRVSFDNNAFHNLANARKKCQTELDQLVYGYRRLQEFDCVQKNDTYLMDAVANMGLTFLSIAKNEYTSLRDHMG